MPTAEQVTNWKQRVDESQGTLVFLPEEFEERVKELEADRNAFNEKVKEMARLEIEMRVKQEQILLDIRRKLFEDDPAVWIKDIAMNGEALKDGVYVVHLVEQRPRGM